MNFTQYLIEANRAVADQYTQFNQDYKAALGQTPPSAQKLVGMLNRRSHTPGQNPELDFVTDWFTKHGFLTRKGKMVVPTPKGSQLRQSLPQVNQGSSDLSKAAGNHKKLRRYFMNVTDEVTKEWLSTLDDNTLDMIAKGRELEEEDIAILNGIRDRAEKHQERTSYITAMLDKNPERINRLASLGFLHEKGLVFVKEAWDNFVKTISSLDPARVKTVIPNFFKWATHHSGNVAKNVNRILFAIHPESRNQTETGRAVWRMIKNLPDDTIATIQRGKKPAQGELSDSAYNLLTSVVASVIRTFPNAKTADELIKTLDDAFESRVDFKSLDRSAEKVGDRRSAARDLFN